MSTTTPTTTTTTTTITRPGMPPMTVTVPHRQVAASVARQKRAEDVVALNQAKPGAVTYASTGTEAKPTTVAPYPFGGQKHTLSSMNTSHRSRYLLPPQPLPQPRPLKQADLKLMMQGPVQVPKFFVPPPRGQVLRIVQQPRNRGTQH